MQNRSMELRGLTVLAATFSDLVRKEVSRTHGLGHCVCHPMNGGCVDLVRQAYVVQFIGDKDREAVIAFLSRSTSYEP